MSDRVPVHVMAGFLGAGKTTALVRLLRQRAPHERIAVVVNDFGEAAIDAELVAQCGVPLAEVRGACLCCTAPAGFQADLGRLLDREKPERIFVEPTGLALPADLIDTLRRAPYADRIEIAPVLVFVDPTALRGGEAGVPLVRAQAEAADILVATRADVSTEVQRARFEALADGLWPGPRARLHVAHGELPSWVLDGVRAVPAAGFRPVKAGAGAGAHGFAVRTVRWPRERVFSLERLAAALATAAGGGFGVVPVRLKGMFRTELGTVLLEIAGGQVSERPSAHRAESVLDVFVAEGEAETGLHAFFEALEAAAYQAGDAPDLGCVTVVLPGRAAQQFDRAALLGLPDGVADVSVLVPGRQGEAARLSALLAAAGAPAEGSLVVEARDGFASAPVALADVRAGLLVHTLGGEALPDGQGGPVRLLVPAGAVAAGPCANVKGVVRLVVRA